jgi:hypothetical protein
MSFVGFGGSTSTNLNTESYLLVSCPTVPDTLVLCEFGDGSEPYQGFATGFDGSDGRSLLGAIRTKGNNYPIKQRLELSFLATSEMLVAFEAILEAQRQGQVAVVDDAWRSAGVSRSMWLDVADRYRTEAGDGWYLLQFSAWEV